MKNQKEQPTNRVSYGINNMIDDIMGDKKVFLITVVTSLILSILAVSYITLTVVGIFDKTVQITFISLLTAWISNPVSVVLTVIFFVIFSFTTYKARLLFKQDKVSMSSEDYNYNIAETDDYGKAHYGTEEEKNVMLERSPNFDDVKGDILGFEGEVIETNGDKHKYRITNICAMKPNLLSTNYCKIVYGAAGSGKSAAVVYNDIIQAAKRGDSVIATDSKGDVYRETAAIMRKHGYVIRILNIKPEELMNSDAWEPLKYVGQTTESEIQADVLAQAIVVNTLNGGKMDFWADNEKNCLKAAILLVAQSADYEGRRTMAEVANIIADPEHFDSKFINLPEESAAKRAFNIYYVSKDDVKKQILNGLGIRLQLLNNPYVKHIMSHDEIDLVLPMKRKCIYYVCISDTDTTMNFIGAMFFTQIFQAQCNYSDSLSKEDKKKQLPVRYELDEFKNIGTIPDFDKKIATFRSRKISSTIILQNISQLESMYPNKGHQTLLGNTTTHILLKAGDTDTAKYFSDLCGKTTIKVENSKYDKRRSQIIDLHDEEGITEGLGQRDILMMNEAMQLAPDDMIVCILGFPPLRLHKYITEIYNPVYLAEHKEMQTNRHRPRWMKELMESEQKDKEYIEMLRKNREEGVSPVNNEPVKSLPNPMGTSKDTKDSRDTRDNRGNRPNLANKQAPSDRRDARESGNPRNTDRRDNRDSRNDRDTRDRQNNRDEGDKGQGYDNKPYKKDNPVRDNRPVKDAGKGNKPDRSNDNGRTNNSGGNNKPVNPQKKDRDRSERNPASRDTAQRGEPMRKGLMNLTEEPETEVAESTPDTEVLFAKESHTEPAADTAASDKATSVDTDHTEPEDTSDDVFEEPDEINEDTDVEDGAPEETPELTEEDIQDEIPEEDSNSTKGMDIFGAMFSDADLF